MTQATKPTASHTATDVAQRFPDAVALARQFRELFGDGVRLTYARNAAGEELGRRYT